MNDRATSRLRMWGYCLVLTAVAFVQQPGRIVGDTKFDLAVDPLGFLARAVQLWDPVAAFGQLQNQAYGYFLPMGPFFVLGDAAALPAWVVQRLWWALLLSVAFVGVVLLARALRLGAPWAQVVAGFAYALSAHVLTLLGPTSVEAWPTAVAPWVLLPLVRASESGSVRRGAAASALFVALCGGVNAVAVLAVLPLGAAWLLTRTGTRRWHLFGWWVLFTVLATAWWVVPLLILGRYSVPFLDYIENAPITTLPTSLPDILAGTSDWVAYVSPQDWVAGNLLGTTPILLLNLAVVAGAGLAGAVMRDNPHRQFLLLGVVVGAALVGFGYTGPLAGWWAGERELLLDGALAPFRNLHKFDVVLRLALTLGLAHFLTAVAARARTTTGRLPLQMVLLATVVSVVGAAVPAYAGRIAPGGSFEEVPDYWRDVAAYLEEAPRNGVALEVPASGFGDYRWGSPHDDVLQPLSSGPWAVRNVIPLSQPGNVRFLDAITRAVEAGRPSPALAAFLRRNGVDHLVVRNDLEPSRGAVPDPVVLHQALDRSPGLEKVAEFGPPLGERPVSYVDPSGDASADPDAPGTTRQGEGRVRVLANRGRQARFAAVEVYAVAGRVARVSSWRAGSVPVVAGGPAAGLETPARVLAGPTVLAGDREHPAFAESPRVLTDGLRRREMAFTSVRNNQSATLAPRDPWRLDSVVPNHRIYDEQGAYESVGAWRGVAGVRASSAQSWADSLPPIRPDQRPGSALDGLRRTSWVSAGSDGAVGEWWQVDLGRKQTLRSIRVVAGSAVGAPVTRLRIVTDAGHVTVPAPLPRRARTYDLPQGATSFVRIRAQSIEEQVPGAQFALAEVGLPGVDAAWFLRPPDVFDAPADHVLLAREADRPACAVVDGTDVCDDFWRSHGEEQGAVRRRLDWPGEATYTNRLTAVVRAGRRSVRAVGKQLPVRVTSSSTLSTDVRASALAAVDSDPDTAWIARPGGPSPRLRLRWDAPHALSTVDFDLAPGSPGARPERVVLRSGEERRVVRLDGGRGDFPELVTDAVTIRIAEVEEAYSFESGQARRLPAGVGELSFPYSSVPEVDPDARIDLGCGSGPTLEVGGVVERTRLATTLGQVMNGGSIPVRWCGDGRTTLRAGGNDLSALPSDVAVPDQLHLRRVGVAASAPEREAARVETWTPDQRSVALPERDAPVLLAVRENFNPGWQASVDGRPLASQRVDGWRQGWVVPAGGATTVTATFTPNRAYQTALLAGLGLLLLVVAAAVVPVRRGTTTPPAVAADARWLVLGTSVAALGLAGGWLGVGLVAVAVTVGLLERGRAAGPASADVALDIWPWAAGAVLATSGLAHAYARSDGFQVSWWPAQLLALLALALAVAAVVANGPTFLRRRKGRSRSW